jgi:predicted RNA-binding Zn ribbon-like protein
MRDVQKQFIFIGNHPCLDFINTLIAQNGKAVDLLETSSDLADWLEQAHVLNRGPAKHVERNWHGKSGGVQTLEEIRKFRGVLRHMIERIAGRKPVPQVTIGAINRILRDRVGYYQLKARAGKFEQTFQTESEEATHVLGLLAESASDLLRTCDLSLIKQCQNPACVLFFYDTTKNHARHWCSMSGCGNRMKVAAHYRRQRSAE